MPSPSERKSRDRYGEERMKKTCVRWALALAAICVCAFCTWAESTAGVSFQQTAISPDGNRVAWVQDSTNAAGESTSGTSIYVDDWKAGAKPRRISASNGGPASENSIAWAPDSKRIAFLSDAGDSGQAQLYVASADGGTARKLTNLSGFLADPRWSPDGRAVALLFTENAPRAAGPLMPMTPATGVIDQKIYEQRLTLVDVGSGKVTQVSPADMYVYEYDWSPDGKSFVATAAHGAGDANWYVAQIYTLNTASKEMKSVYKPKLQIAVPRWSPDGKRIAFIEGLMSDEGFTGGDIFVLDSNGGEPKDVTPGIAASPSALYWESPDRILFSEQIDGNSGIARVDVSSGKVAQLWTGSDIIETESFYRSIAISLASNHEESAVIRHSWARPPEVWAGRTGDWKQVTHLNDALHSQWGDMKSLHWMSDGLKIQGWLMYPKDYDASRRYPMVVVVHGGPAGTAHTGWPEPFFNTFELSAHGYFVLNPNPRGSFGQGEKFTEANVKDFGYGDFRDILAGVDEAVKTLPIDNDRVGITGWSYGGYMTMWAVTQTQRFRAAMAGAGIADWLSYYGENDIDEWMPPYFGTTVYDDPAVYAKSAPINYIKNAKTPTLVLVGELDGECPAPQSLEFWHALKSSGVQTELVIYPGEGHVFLQPQHERDVMERLMAWFDHYLKSPDGNQVAGR